MTALSARSQVQRWRPQGAGAGGRGKGSIPFPHLRRTGGREDQSVRIGDGGCWGGGTPRLLGPQSQARGRSSPDPSDGIFLNSSTQLDTVGRRQRVPVRRQQAENIRWKGSGLKGGAPGPTASLLYDPGKPRPLSGPQSPCLQIGTWVWT